MAFFLKRLEKIKIFLAKGSMAGVQSADSGMFCYTEHCCNGTPILLHFFGL